MFSSQLKNRRILLVDDEQALLDMAESILKESGFENIKTAATIREAVEVTKSFLPELAVLDVMLPDGNGFTLYEKLRTFTDIPVLFLTALGEDADRIRGLELGADDYMVKPFLGKELVLRIGMILKRYYRETDPLVKLAGCEIDFSRAEVKKDGQCQSLTAKEYNILQALYRNEGRIVTIDQLCESAWGENPYGYENSLMAHIRRIREKIESNPSKPDSLITVKGLGYKLIARRD